MSPLGTPAPDFSLLNVDGRVVSLADFAGAPALLVMFICNIKWKLSCEPDYFNPSGVG